MKKYYIKMKKLINTSRQQGMNKVGPMNKESRAALKKLSDLHTLDKEPLGFGGSALVSRWYDQFIQDKTKYPAMGEDEMDSDEE